MKRRKRSLADFLTDLFGTTGFLCINIFFFAFWIFVNAGIVPYLVVFDPFPFNLLTTFVSLEAIFLSVIVLISQNRAAETESIREEMDFRVNVAAEQEITKILGMLERVERHLKMKTKGDKELTKMRRKLNIERIAEEVMRERLQR